MLVFFLYEVPPQPHRFQNLSCIEDRQFKRKRPRLPQISKQVASE